MTEHYEDTDEVKERVLPPMDEEFAKSFKAESHSTDGTLTRARTAATEAQNVHLFRQFMRADSII